MKADYKNWVPKNMLIGSISGSIICFGIFVAAFFGSFSSLKLKIFVSVILFSVFLAVGYMAVWSVLAYRAFSYKGKRQLSRRIVDGTAGYVKLKAGQKCLDIGCGSGALSIAIAKKNPNGHIIGVDRWGKEYASFSKQLCENNAKAEGVLNTEFKNGNAIKLDFPDESFDAITSNYVYHNIMGKDKQELLLESLRVLKKGGCFAIHDLMSKSRYGDMENFVKCLKEAGYEKVEFIETSKGLFMSEKEGRLFKLSGSAILTGIK
ncbi:MAG: class I SAM-dependent methyltransferase [Candidatus Fimenecus sp.]